MRFKIDLSALVRSLKVTRIALHEHQLLKELSNECCDCVTDNFRIVSMVVAGGYMYWNSKPVFQRWFVPLNHKYLYSGVFQSEYFVSLTVLGLPSYSACFEVK